MSNRPRLSRYRVVFGVLLAIVLSTGISATENSLPPELTITVGDTVGTSGQQNSVITVSMANPFDSVVAFTLLLRIGDHTIMEFQTDTATVYDTTWWICVDWDGPVCTTWVGSDYETTYWVCDEYDGPTCIDSSQVPPDSAYDFFHEADTMLVDTVEIVYGSIDTAGTLISGWESVDSRSVIVEGQDIKITAQADRLIIPGTVPGIPPQQGNVLFRLLADIFPMDDSVTDRTSTIFPDPFLKYFSFSTPEGYSLGLSDSLRPDTNYWHCDNWVPPDSTVCLEWEKVYAGDPWDSMSVEFDTVTYFDDSKCKLYPGQLTVLPGACGQLDDDALGEIDIGDLTYLIAYLYIQGPAPDPLSAANMDCSMDDVVDIGDLTHLIAFLFMNGEEPCAACQ